MATGREIRQAAATLANAASALRFYEPVFGGPPGESTAAWMDRLLEFDMAARGGGCWGNPHEWGAWGPARWRADKERRDCLKCNQLEMRWLPTPPERVVVEPPRRSRLRRLFS